MPTSKSALKLVVMGLVVTASVSQAMAQPVVRQFLQPDNLDYIRNSQVLGIPTSHCGHVIDLLESNRLRQQTGCIGEGEVCLPHLTVGMKPGDLELLCVNLVCDGDACKGPVFQIGMRNNSCVPIGNFKVSVVGVLCQIHVHSPTATVCIPRMEPGEEMQIQVQLPVTCMCMGPIGQQCAFDTLIVALDSFDDLLECNELNNVQILKRADIELLVVETTTTETVEVTPETPAAPAPAETAPVTPAPQPKAPSPLDNLDLDDLGLGESQSELFGRR